jgi:hypothetical protein
MKRRRRAPTPPRVYPAGYFCELVYRHNWPPRFEPRAATNMPRPVQSNQGGGWGEGTIYLTGTPKTGAPGWMLGGRE